MKNEGKEIGLGNWRGGGFEGVGGVSCILLYFFLISFPYFSLHCFILLLVDIWMAFVYRLDTQRTTVRRYCWGLDDGLCFSFVFAPGMSGMHERRFRCHYLFSRKSGYFISFLDS